MLLITPDQSDYTLYYQPQQTSTILDHTRKVGTTLSQTIKPNRLETQITLCMVICFGRKRYLKQKRFYKHKLKRIKD